VPDGYACVRVDSRGAGRSPGHLDVWSPREAQDLYHCVEWAGTQPWSNGKVGINGISYYAMNQWQVGALRPPHLAALCIWEGSSDYYRELCRHGGILSQFLASWIRARWRACSTGWASAAQGALSPASRWRGRRR
jgi:putative CocE/NonD family hydrolase